MRIDILTLFPEMFECVLSASMLGRAQANGLMDEYMRFDVASVCGGQIDVIKNAFDFVE